MYNSNYISGNDTPRPMNDRATKLQRAEYLTSQILALWSELKEVQNDLQQDFLGSRLTNEINTLRPGAAQRAIDLRRKPPGHSAAIRQAYKKARDTGECMVVFATRLLNAQNEVTLRIYPLKEALYATAKDLPGLRIVNVCAPHETNYLAKTSGRKDPIEVEAIAKLQAAGFVMAYLENNPNPFPVAKAVDQPAEDSNDNTEVAEGSSGSPNPGDDS